MTPSIAIGIVVALIFAGAFCIALLDDYEENNDDE